MTVFFQVSNNKNAIHVKVVHKESEGKQKKAGVSLSLSRLIFKSNPEIDLKN